MFLIFIISVKLFNKYIYYKGNNKNKKGVL